MPRRRKATNTTEDSKKDVLKAAALDSDAEGSSRKSEPPTPDAIRKPSCDFYCIVEILEANQKALIAIPHKWLRGNALHWPNYIREENIRFALEDGSSEPEKGWWQKPCVLKRQGFLSKLDADIEISNMTGIFHTDQSNSGNNALPLADVRAIVRQELLSVESQLKAGMQKLDKQLAKMSAMLVKKTSEISTQLCSTISPQKHDLSALSLSLPNLCGLSDFSFEIISEMEQLNELELRLKSDSAYKLQFISYMSQYCGKNNDMHTKGWDASYTVIDRLWTRQFLTRFSWTGNSMSDKFEFRLYSAVIGAFYEIIHNADNAFTITEAEKFLRQQLKNSKKRASLKFARTGRRKIKRHSSVHNLGAIKVQKNDDNESEEDYAQYNAINKTDHQHSEEGLLQDNDTEDEIKNVVEVEMMNII